MVKGKFQTYFPFEKNCLTYSCLHCRAHLARHDDLISKSFQGSQGRAYLFNQYSTPQARRVSKINSQNLRVTFNSNLGKLNRKRPKYRLRASSASPSRDFLLLTGSDNDDEEEESTDNRSSDFIDFNRQTHNIVQVQD
uniref:Protein yippee-like 1 n=2 Tax=Schistosoma japonicum TaxID=6182 RepID=C1L438_SCHJA|nr:Protein yippee-like 1 [Schistosoma japonicum]